MSGAHRLQISWKLETLKNMLTLETVSQYYQNGNSRKREIQNFMSFIKSISDTAFSCLLEKQMLKYVKIVNMGPHLGGALSSKSFTK